MQKHWKCISYRNGCTVFDRIKESLKPGESFSSKTMELLEQALKFQKMDSFFVGDIAPRDETPIHEWKTFLKSKDINSIKLLLKKRREINILLENVLLD